MSVRPVVIKLGGDALSTPERIAAQARRLARRAESEPVVAVVSARRGVTDHLLGLTASIRQQLPPKDELEHRAAAAESDRVVATGEVVTAALLALALNQLGVEAVSLDAREAGISSKGSFGGATIHEVAPNKIKRLLAQNIIPVVTGFQGWQHGRVATLGRGGTDTSAVALAVALGARSAIFVKETAGLRTADPRLVPISLRIPETSHSFLTALAAAGARIIHVEAARLAEHESLGLEFWSLEGDEADTIIDRSREPAPVRAVASALLDGVAQLTALASAAEDLLGEAEYLRSALHAAGVTVIETQPAANGLRLIVPADQADAGVRALHAAFVVEPHAKRTRRAS